MSLRVSWPPGPVHCPVELKMVLVTGKTGSAAVSEPTKPLSVTITSHAARSWTVDLSSTVMWFRSQGADVLWCAVFMVQTGSMIFMATASSLAVPGRKTPSASVGMRTWSGVMSA